MGVTNAVVSVHKVLAPMLLGKDPREQGDLDKIMTTELDHSSERTIPVRTLCPVPLAGTSVEASVVGSLPRILTCGGVRVNCNQKPCSAGVSGSHLQDPSPFQPQVDSLYVLRWTASFVLSVCSWVQTQCERFLWPSAKRGQLRKT